MKTDKFITFLRESGAEVLETTNEWEIARFRTMNGVSVVYQNRKGKLSFTNEAYEAYEKFQDKTIWTIHDKWQKKKIKLKKEILDRDPNECLYCGCGLTEESATLEHILSISNGGNNNLANLALSCADCNKAVGSWPITEKIKFRENKRRAA